jgi:hypothetical protein
MTPPVIAPATPKKEPPTRAGIVNNPVSIVPNSKSGIALFIYRFAIVNESIGTKPRMNTIGPIGSFLSSVK